MLLLCNGRTVSTRELTDTLWQDAPPASARANFHSYVSTLREHLGDTLLTAAHGGYRVQVATKDLDAALFAHLVAKARTAARTGRPQEAVRGFTTALNLWRGEVLETLEMTQTLRDEAAGLRELRLSAEDELMDAYLDVREPAHLVAEFRKLVRAEPYREHRWGRLMTVLHRCGRVKEALATYQELSALLDGELGVGPCEELRALHDQIFAAADTGRDTVFPQPRWQGPQPYVSVVGREQQHAELAALTMRGGLVTITGPGGCGKSALALATAQTLAARFAHGVTVIDPATAGTMAPDTLPGPGTGRHTLVVLDDCEHQPSVAALARRLLSQPGSTVLATSRAPLRISGEVTWPLGPLPTPVADEETAATRLFVQRAAQATPGFRAGVGHQALVARICRSLDGLPLAIELAATRLRVLSLPELAERLDTGLECLLAPATGVPRRYESLTSAFVWAHDRLSTNERLLLRHLAQWEGEFSLADVETTVEFHRQSGCALQLLAGLVEQSFVQSQDTPDGRRLRLLAPVRAFVAQVAAQERVGDRWAVLRAVPASTG
ncbi:AfsR/SARP family transcriptional regulator [Streptomyces caeruleatus]|nr:BTAD domain-containing putative transcriptional regulator [Streptomyces caeruleatus]